MVDILGEECFEDGIEYSSNVNIRATALDSAEYCQSMCYAVSACNAWSYHKTQKKCWLKTTADTDTVANSDYISGPKSCVGK